MRALPRLVTRLCMIHDAWVVGSAAQPGAGEVRDYDVLVPWPRWNEAALLVPRDARPNAFGGTDPFLFEGTLTGRTLTSTARQVVEYTPDGASLSGQGIFVRGKGGVIVLDVGRLVGTWADGTTFMSAQVIPVEPGPAQEELEAALCDALG